VNRKIRIAAVVGAAMTRWVSTLVLLCAMLNGAQAGERVWVHERICSIEDASECVEWSTTEDVRIAPPGWTGTAEGEACVWKDDLDGGKCRPMEGWTQVPVSKSDILIRNRASPLVLNQDIDTARTWPGLSGWEQIQIRLQKAVIYDYITFTRSKQCKPEDALTCADTWMRRDAQTETIAAPEPVPAAPAPPAKSAQRAQPTPRLRFAPHATPGSGWPPQW
jgi:hypothetical protein